MDIFDKIIGSYSERELKRIEPIKNKVLSLDKAMSKLSDDELRYQTNILKGKLSEGKTLDDILPDALAVCREGASRVLGKKAYPVQIIGAIVLHQGRIAQMRTGEGKTLVACLAAYVNSLTGNGVHVVTVNDYLAKFQSEEMGKVFNFLGVSNGCILGGMEQDEKVKAYNCDITYGTNSEFGFDYLRDNMVKNVSEKVQRNHVFAIVDEVDSILIDEARTPLIISMPGDEPTETYAEADRFAKSLKPVVVVEVDKKADNDKLDGDYIIDEKDKTATLTKSGVKKAEKWFGLINLMDQENMALVHYIEQAIKANGVMKNGIDYIVKNDEVVIVDEFTGRIMDGRRFNDGLHQAIEAKEGVKIQKESKTVATVTYQNYFRLYKKLSGMTGTAMTEEEEFREIYKLDVIDIPTNNPVIRKDHDDVVFLTEKAKFNAVIDQIIECQKKKQPVLVGTVSVEKSERLSALLKAKGIKHKVLNAKYHDKEAMIIAQAGKPGSITIATNMAGRGTDILLGGNAEYMALEALQNEGYTEEQTIEAASYSNTNDTDILVAREKYHKFYDEYSKQIKSEQEKVRQNGGLFIIGTERHESRRIDNQLKGRSGRQGDPGESRFYLSLEDDLMRIFGGDRITKMLKTFNTKEDEPLTAKMLTSVIASSQKRIEAKNYSIRKNVLNYDDVMNNQREIIYKQRNEVLNGENIHDNIISMIRGYVNETAEMFLEGEEPANWNTEALINKLIGLADVGSVLEKYVDRKDESYKKDLIEDIVQNALEMYAEKEKEFTSEVLYELERQVLLRVVDVQWMDHIDAMDELKKGIQLRSYAQKNPVVEYRLEGMKMFDEMIETIRRDTVLSLSIVHKQNNRLRINVRQLDAS